MIDSEKILNFNLAQLITLHKTDWRLERANRKTLIYLAFLVINSNELNVLSFDEKKETHRSDVTSVCQR